MNHIYWTEFVVEKQEHYRSKIKFMNTKVSVVKLLLW